MLRLTATVLFSHTQTINSNPLQILTHMMMGNT